MSPYKKPCCGQWNDKCKCAPIELVPCPKCGKPSIKRDPQIPCLRWECVNAKGAA